MWLLLPLLVRKTPARMINIPNKEYWLATDEHREECIKLITTMMSGIAFLTNLMWGVIYHGIIQGNIETRIHLRMWAIFALAGIILIFVFVYLLTAFKKPVASR